MHSARLIGFSWPRIVCLAGIACAWLLGTSPALADGVFVYRFQWDKQKDINEPTQKAIILFDQGREDMVLQVKYEGPAEDFGWVIPVPGLPEVRKGSMNCFYELSRLTQRSFGDGPVVMAATASLGRSESAPPAVKVIKVNTVGAYEVTVLSATNAASLGQWLEAHHFLIPNGQQSVLDGYIKKQWYFVAVKIDPTQNGFVFPKGSPKQAPDRSTISPATRKKLANGELNPLVISFPAQTAVFPLAISAINGKPSEVSLYILSSEPLASRVILDKKLADCHQQATNWLGERQRRREEDKKAREEAQQRIQQAQAEARRSGSSPVGFGEELFRPSDDPTDPMPRATLKASATWAATRQSGLPESEDDFYSRAGLVQAMEVGPKDLSACGKALPRLTGKPWWLIKEVQVFPPDEMRDLEFEPVIPILAGKLGTPEGQAAASAMTQYRGRAIPALLAALKSSDPNERRRAAFACGISYTRDPRLVAYIPDLLQDGDARTRAYGCNVARLNWDKAIVPRLQELLGDENQAVGSAAYKCLQEHLDASQLPVYRKLAEDDGPAALPAVSLVGTNFTRDQLLHLLGSTNHEVVISAFSQLRSGDLSLQEVETVLTNTLPVVRALGIGALTRLGDKSSVDRLVAMLRDPDEFVRWRVRSSLRYLSGLKLGPDPAAWEKWWTENKQDYTPTPRPGPRSGIR